jgi:hypothetical protein
MSLYKPRIGSSTFSGRPLHPGPGSHEPSPSSAATIPQSPLSGDPPELALSDQTPAWLMPRPLSDSWGREKYKFGHLDKTKDLAGTTTGTSHS